jgi:hypothetical protein
MVKPYMQEDTIHPEGTTTLAYQCRSVSEALKSLQFFTVMNLTDIRPLHGNPLYTTDFDSKLIISPDSKNKNRTTGGRGVWSRGKESSHVILLKPLNIVLRRRLNSGRLAS